MPAKLPGAIATKKTGERTANPADTSLPPPFVDPVTAVGSIMSVAASATPVIHVGEIPRGGSSGQGPSTPLGAVPGLSAITQTLPVVLRSLAETSSPSGSSSPDRNPPGAGGNIAFALQLSWQASGPKRESNIPDATQSDAIQPREPDAKNPSDVAGQTAQSAGCNEGALRLGSAGGEKQTGLSVPDPALLEARSSQGSFQLPSSSPSLVPSIPAPLPAAVAIAPQGAELPTPETGPAPLTRGLAAEGSANPDEIDAPSEGWIEGAASSVERPSVSPPGREFREIFTPKTETQTEASTLPSLGQQQGPGQQESHESAKAPRSPVTPSANITASQGTAPNEPGNLPDRDLPTPASDRKAFRIPITDKALQIQTNNQSSSPGAAGVWLDKSGQPSGAGQTPTKISAPHPQHSLSASAEPETTSAVPLQPIREISFRLAADSTNVDVQVAQRAGKLQVAVRTTDQDLAKSLQTNLGELVGRLEDKGFRTEAWTPVAVQHSAAVRDSSNSAHSQSQPNDSGSEGGQQGQRQGQQESNQRQPGRWKTQLEETLSAPIASAQEEEPWYPL